MRSGGTAANQFSQGGKPGGEIERATTETVLGTSALGTVEGLLRMVSPRGSKCRDSL
jgi:hypothetical protein